ncbi:MAG TPA: hypothetical protein VJK51_04705 [Candidatus Nanoarchaeia archaeon]|nr:hypothetical protein [Candidatus Nanoarchaeia archaeon]
MIEEVVDFRQCVSIRDFGLGFSSRLFRTIIYPVSCLSSYELNDRECEWLSEEDCEQFESFPKDLKRFL